MARPNPELTYQSLNAVYVASNGYTNTVARQVPTMWRTYTGTTTPNYFVLNSVPHGLPANDYHCQIAKRSSRLLHEYKEVVGSVPLAWSDYSDLPGNILPPWPDYTWDIVHSSAAYEAAKAKVIKRIKDQSINIAQAYAEKQQTIDMVAQTAVKIANALRNVKKGNFKQAAKDLTGKTGGKSTGSTIADNWLELQYGWKPLLGDVFGACEHLAKKTQPPILKFRAKATVDDSRRNISSFLDCGTVTQRELSYSSTCKFVVAYSMSNPPVRELSKLGIINPLTLAWELLPYSFVVDWFLPVGDFLNSFGYDDGLTFRMGSMVQITKNAWTLDCSGRTFTDSFGHRRTYWGGNLVTSQNVLFDRSRLLAAPTPSLPSFQNPLSFEHLANALALLQKFGR